MAYSLRLQGVPRDHGKTIWSVDEVPWDHRELITDPRFREVILHGETDYVAVLSPEEASELHQKYCGKKEKRIRDLLKLEAPESCWVLAYLYWWESGLSD